MRAFYFLILCCLACLSAQAQIIRYVKPSAMGSGDGSSWANATGDLQSAINSLTATGGQVWVAAGLYKPTSTTARDISFTLKSNVSVYGGFGGNETALSDRPANRPSSTTLSGNIGDENVNTDNSYHVLVCRDVDNTGLLDGFVITGGYAAAAFNANSDESGGAVHMSFSSARFNNCYFIANSAAGDSGGGGAIYNINNNRFGGSYSPLFTNCFFLNNSSTQRGGAIASFSSSFVNTTFILTNCSFVGNTSTLGGAIFTGSSTGSEEFRMTNCSLFNNQANNGGAIGYNRTSFSNIVSRLLNCVLFNNGGAYTFARDLYSTPVVSRYSLFEESVNWYISDGTNLTTTTSPFTSTSSTRLAPGSSAIDAGDPASTTATSGTTDLAGNPRFIGPRIDMGAYEYFDCSSQSLAITQQPISGTTVCEGTAVTATVSVSGVNASYQWYKDGVSLGTAQQGSTLTLPTVTTAQAGNYLVVVSSICNSVTSAAFSLSVNPAPGATLVSSNTITCSNPTAILTAGGGNQYIYGGPGIVSQAPASATALVNLGGTYSVTVTGANGCLATQTTEVAASTMAPAVTLTASGTLTCAQTSVTLTAEGGASYLFDGPGVVSQSGNTALVNRAGVYSVTATGANGCTAIQTAEVVLSNTNPSPLIVTVSGPLNCSITNVTLTATAGFASYYFSEGAQQQGGSDVNVAYVSSSGVYAVTAVNALGCQSLATVSVTYQNCPPAFTNPIAPQSATLNQTFTLLIPSNTFTDTETPNNLSLSVSGLPAGFVFTAPATISGTPSSTIGSPFSVTVVATDPSNLTTSTTFLLSITQPQPFTITGVALVSCEEVSPTHRTIRFTPSYGSLTGLPISFSVVNELLPTTNPGPYQLTLNTDNSVITLKAVQQGSSGEASYAYNWVAACANPICTSMFTVKAGNWSDASVWSCGRVPSIGETVTLNHAITMPDNYQGHALRLIYAVPGKLTLGTSSAVRLE